MSYMFLLGQSPLGTFDKKALSALQASCQSQIHHSFLLMDCSLTGSAALHMLVLQFPEMFQQNVRVREGKGSCHLSTEQLL